MSFTIFLWNYFFLLFYVGNFAHAVTETNSLIADVSPNCDFTHFETQLKALNAGNEFLKLRFEMFQLQMDAQKQFLQGLEQKVNKIPHILQSMENKLLHQNKEYLREINDLISRNQLQNLTPVVDDKWPIVSDIKEIVKEHDTLLESFNKKLQNIESILTKASWETHSKELGDSIAKNLPILQNIDMKLTNIETSGKANQIAFNRDMQKYLNKNGSPKICLKSEDHKLVCTAQTYPTNCADFNENYCSNNKCRIYNPHIGPNPFLVACDDHSEGGGWTVIQRRLNGSVDFYRNWSEYKDEFGNIDGEFFIGLDKLHALTMTLQPVELLVQMQDFNDTTKYAKFDEFLVGNETENYKLIKVGNYYGNAGDSLSSHQGSYFTTKDRDNDENKTGNCAVEKEGAWWYESCYWSNLNGKYYDNGGLPKGKKGISWGMFHGYDYSLKFVQMSIRSKRI